MNLEGKKVFVQSFTFGVKSKKYPYPMVREVDLKETIRKLKKKYGTKDGVAEICPYVLVSFEDLDKMFGFVKVALGEKK